MDLLVDKDSGAIVPEPGPNMMWNAEYGMMGRRSGMMGSYASGEMSLSAPEAGDVAQRWLDANLPGRTTGKADVFYGYYTLHFLNVVQIEGMLSVHGNSGDVWYHSWHGDFVATTENLSVTGEALSQRGGPESAHPVVILWASVDLCPRPGGTALGKKRPANQSQLLSNQARRWHARLL